LVITDDLDGSPGAETVTFGLDGVSYEIDLAQPNRARLSEARAIHHGRQAGEPWRTPRRWSGGQGASRPRRRAGLGSGGRPDGI